AKCLCGRHVRCVTMIHGDRGVSARSSSKSRAPSQTACVTRGVAVMPHDGDPIWRSDLEITKEAKQLQKLNNDVAFSEDGLALEFAARHAADLRYVAAGGYWLHWRATGWTRERTLKVFDLARDVARDAVARGADPKRLLSAKTIAAIERLAESDRRHAATA